MIIDEDRYIKAYSNVFNVSEDKVRAFTKKKGLDALITNADDIFTTKKQREKYKSFLSLYNMSDAISNIEHKIESLGDFLNYVRASMPAIFDKEAMAVISCNTKGKVLDVNTAATGTLSEVPMYTREIFKNAIINKASYIFIAHNHPSGDVSPSEADYQCTKKMIRAGEALGIPVRDHIIITGFDRGKYYSFAEQGLIDRYRSQIINMFMNEDSSIYENEAKEDEVFEL